MAVAAAQNSSETRGPAANPNMSTGGANSGRSSMSKPSTSNPRARHQRAANPGSTKAMDEQANGTGQAVERNPDGSRWLEVKSVAALADA